MPAGNRSLGACVHANGGCSSRNRLGRNVTYLERIGLLALVVFIVVAVGWASRTPSHAMPTGDKGLPGKWLGDARCYDGSKGTAALEVTSVVFNEFHGKMSYSPWGFCEQYHDEYLWGTVNPDGSLQGNIFAGHYFYSRTNDWTLQYNWDQQLGGVDKWIHGRLVKQAGEPMPVPAQPTN